MKVVGIDPAKEIAKKAIEDGIETVVDFFSYNIAVDLREFKTRKSAGMFATN